MTGKACGTKETKRRAVENSDQYYFLSAFLWCFTAYPSGFYVQGIGMLSVNPFVGFTMMLHNFIIRSAAECGETKACFLILNYFWFTFKKQWYLAACCLTTGYRWATCLLYVAAGKWEKFCYEVWHVCVKRHLILKILRLCQAMQSELTTVVFVFITALLEKSYCLMLYSVGIFEVLIAGKKGK